MGTARGGASLRKDALMPRVTGDRDDPLDALDINTVCHRSGFGRSFVYEEIRAGRLIARKYGRLTRILRTDYEAWLAVAPRIAPAPPLECGRSPKPELDPIKVSDDRPNSAVGTIDCSAAIWIGNERQSE